MDQLSPQDAQFLYMETEDNHIQVTAVAVFDPSTVPGGKTVRFKEILAHIESRLHMSSVFRRRLIRVPLELDYPYWVDDEHFDLEYHVQHVRLPAPGDWRQFCILLSRFHARPLDLGRPLWEMLVIEGLDQVEGLPEGSYAIATKLHHAAVDGASVMKFYRALVDVDNKGTPAVALDSVEDTRSPRPGLINMGLRAAWNTVRSPIGMTDAVMRSAPAIYRWAQSALSTERKARHVVPDTRFNCNTSPHTMFDATSCTLDEVKAIRETVPGSTINDIILAVCAGALRRYLEHHEELPNESLVAWVPINARRGSAEADEDIGNRVTSMTTPIFTDIEDPLERLQRIHASTRRSKAARSGVSARLMTDLSQHVPAATLVTAGRLVLRAGMAANLCNLFISNVPGPQVPVFMNGAKQVATYGLAPLVDGMGLFIATPSYDGKISFNVTSTRETLPDIDFFVDCIDASLAELSKIGTKPKTRRARRK
ncbi:MAG: wax ester/triacylglycerol synthase family O-acyltransferase [Gammaproteobacteria bacterium]|nr:wax ester/triacylglycerol synthase family O-acyltransferase [Gammaproteobacteria bacterium]NNF49133.1 wax ester/triacylglycerol synthase family O-acyltransferase [Woeseiaceae bacterium]MBT8094079.1 wax ester/triacylglycerol synthase family O-acyltransferase [Gammaproteobacteria bacterium]MBT8104361.1 wax ester/triacylglycerol synthase family O-acyltransferase [Gammaproteobacteria bacterium]NNK24377.1 wax ester/triacylglycerol synthase family O-acyltransferase [Woeseiaceae bacterium]